MPNYDDLRNLPEAIPTTLGALKSTPSTVVSAIQEQRTKARADAFYRKMSLRNFETKDMRFIAVDLYGEDPTQDVKEVKVQSLDDWDDDEEPPKKKKSPTVEDDELAKKPLKSAHTGFTATDHSGGFKKGEMVVYAGGSAKPAKKAASAQIPCGTPKHPEVDEPTLYHTTKQFGTTKILVYFRVWLPDKGWCKGISLERLTKLYNGRTPSDEGWARDLMTPFGKNEYFANVLSFEPLKGKIDDRLYEYLYKNTIEKHKPRMKVKPGPKKPKWVHGAGVVHRVYPGGSYSHGLSFGYIRACAEGRAATSQDAHIRDVFGEHSDRFITRPASIAPYPAPLPGDIEAYLNRVIGQGTESCSE